MRFSGPDLALACIAMTASLVSACSGTRVISSATALPNQMAPGLIEVKGGFSGYIANGVVAISEAKRGDLVWRIERAGKRVDLCDAQGCEPAAAVEGAQMPRSFIRFLETKGSRPAAPEAGVWMTGGRILRTLHYCWSKDTESKRPVCEQVKFEGKNVLSYFPISTHTIQKDGAVQDVIWLLNFGQLTRCFRARARTECRFTAFQ